MPTTTPEETPIVGGIILPGTVKSTDVYVAVDTTDPTQSPSGSTKNYTIQELSVFINTGGLGITLTGDITGAGDSPIATTIANNVVTNDNLAILPALTLLGNNNATPSNAAYLTVAQILAMLNVGTLAGTQFNTQSTSLTTVVTNTTNNSFATIAGLSATITPSITNKVLVRVTLTWSANSNVYFCGFRLLRGSTPIGLATSTSGSTALSAGAYFSIFTTTNDIATTVIEFLDTPATAFATTYSVQSWTGGPQNITINAANGDTGAAVFPRGISTITICEIQS